MRKLALVAALLAGLAGSARAQDPGAAIRQVISDQIAAFRADDLATAFSYASPAIREMFGDADRFGRMVRDGYPMVWRPGNVRFAALEDRNGRWVQGVIVTDQAGALHVLDYEKVPLDGEWRINGVSLRPPDAAGA
jgi:hypothetical protein